MNGITADPIKASEIVEILGLGPEVFNIPRQFNKIRDVVDYFSPMDNMRYYLLKVVSGKPGERLDAAWNYVALQREREAILSRFEASEFAPDIEQQLEQKYLTRENMTRIRQDVDMKKQLIAERNRNRQQTADVRATEQAAMKKINLTEISNNLNDLEAINNIIDKHE